MSASGAFPGWWAKVRRAEEHFYTLKQDIEVLFSVKVGAPRLGVKFDPQTGQHVLWINKCLDFGAFNARAALILGDGFNNLHSALDHLLFHKSIPLGQLDPDWPRWSKWVKFPIQSNPAAWNAHLGKELRFLTPPQQACIKGFQPCSGGNLEQSIGSPFHPLQMLRDLTDQDKHRLLTPIIVPARGLTDRPFGPGEVFTASVQQGTCRLFSRMAVELNAEVARAYMLADYPKDDVEVAGHLTSEVALADSDWRPALEVAACLAAFVKGVLTDLKAA